MNMRNFSKPLTVALLASLVALSGCLSDEDIPPYDDGVRTANGFTRFGSGRVAPPGHEESDATATVPVTPGQVRWPPLDDAALAELRQGLSEAELLDLLGPPLRKEVMLQGVDRPGPDWNAWVWTWRFIDPDFAQYALVRDLEVRLAEATDYDANRKLVPVTAGGWYVTGWQLY